MTPQKAGLVHEDDVLDTGKVTDQDEDERNSIVGNQQEEVQSENEKPADGENRGSRHLLL